MKDDELVFFNVWETYSEKDQKGLVEAMRDEAHWISGHEGFVSLTVWSCADDRRVIVQERWRTEADFRTAIAENPESAARREAMTKFGQPRAGVYLLDFAITAQGSLS